MSDFFYMALYYFATVPLAGELSLFLLLLLIYVAWRLALRRFPLSRPNLTLIFLATSFLVTGFALVGLGLLSLGWMFWRLIASILISGLLFYLSRKPFPGRLAFALILSIGLYASFHFLFTSVKVVKELPVKWVLDQPESPPNKEKPIEFYYTDFPNHFFHLNSNQVYELVRKYSKSQATAKVEVIYHWGALFEHRLIALDKLTLPPRLHSWMGTRGAFSPAPFPKYYWGWSL